MGVDTCYGVSMKKEPIHSRVVPEIADVLNQLAGEDRRTVSWVVEELLMEALNARGRLPVGLEQRDLRTVPKPATAGKGSPSRRRAPER